MSACYQYRQFDHLRVELPRHWEEKALKYVSMAHSQAFVDGPFGSDLKSDEYVDDGTPLIQLNNIRDGHHVLHNLKFITDEKKLSLSRHVARPGDLVFAKMAEPVARTTLVSCSYDEYVIVADCVKMSADARLVDTGFLVWAINSDCVRINAELVSTGTTRIRISLGELKRLRVPFPPPGEQTQIAKFLDYETAKIDALIKKQQHLVALLKEKRQAVISHAVTKGLNPDAPMRDSGVEWLGEVPAHWVSLAVRHALKIDNGPRLPINRLQRADIAGLYPYWGPTGVLDHIDHYRYEGDRAIIGEDGDHFLKFSIWPMTHWVTGKFNVNNHAHVVADGPKCSAKWFYYSFLHRDIGGDVIAQGVSRLKLTREGLSKLVMAVPPLDEQAALIAHMEPVIAKVEKATAASEQQVELLQERRTALISAAVTGKIDVRDWKAPESAVEEGVA